MFIRPEIKQLCKLMEVAKPTRIVEDEIGFGMIRVTWFGELNERSGYRDHEIKLGWFEKIALGRIARRRIREHSKAKLKERLNKAVETVMDTLPKMDLPRQF